LLFQGIEQCQHDFWLCKCIEKNRICDRHKDCPYVGDEEDFCHSFLCGPDKIRCPTGACIPKSKVKKICLYFTFLLIKIFVFEDM